MQLEVCSDVQQLEDPRQNSSLRREVRLYRNTHPMTLTLAGLGKAFHIQQVNEQSVELGLLDSYGIAYAATAEIDSEWNDISLP